MSMIKLLFRYTHSTKFSVICLKSVSLRDTAVSSQKTAKISIGYGQSVPGGMSDMYCIVLYCIELRFIALRCIA